MSFSRACLSISKYADLEAIFIFWWEKLILPFNPSKKLSTSGWPTRLKIMSVVASEPKTCSKIDIEWDSVNFKERITETVGLFSFIINNSRIVDFVTCYSILVFQDGFYTNVSLDIFH